MERKIVVLQLINSLADGGAETLVKDYATLIDSNKYEVAILTLSPENKSAVSRTLKEHGIKVYTVYKGWNVLTKIKHKLFGKIYVEMALRHVIDIFRPDVIHAHLNTLIYLSDLHEELRSIKLIYTCHNLPVNIFGENGSSTFEAARKLISDNNIKLIALHQEMANELNEMFGINNTEVIKNGIDYSKFLSVTKSKEQIRKELGIPEGAVVIGHVGRFSPPKNHDLILKIFKHYHECNKHAILLLVGEGELKESFIDKVTSSGLMKCTIMLANRSDIAEIDKAMDVFIFPSRWEGFGIALIEAQIAGVPCVASDTVPMATKISNHVIYERLGAPIEKWCEDIDFALNSLIDLSNISHEYDMNLEIKKLEKLYT